MSSTEQLLPCPFCGGKATITTVPTAGTPLYYVECDKCGARTADWSVQAGRVAAWNKRVQPPKPEEPHA